METSTEQGEVLGEIVTVCIDGVMSVFQSRIREMLDEEGIEHPDPRPEEWYSYDQFLRVLQTIEQNTGENALRKVGESTPRFADWPTSPQGPDEALRFLTEMYSDTHRGVTGSYTYEQTGDSAVTVTSTTPYPEAWETGLIKGTAEEFGATYAKVSVLTTADSETVYEVSW